MYTYTDYRHWQLYVYVYLVRGSLVQRVASGWGWADAPCRTPLPQPVSMATDQPSLSERLPSSTLFGQDEEIYSCSLFLCMRNWSAYKKNKVFMFSRDSGNTKDKNFRKNHLWCRTNKVATMITIHVFNTKITSVPAN